MLHKNSLRFALAISLLTVIVVISGYYFLKKTTPLTDFKKAIDAENYQEVGRLLGLFYENGLIKEKQFNDLERDVYIKVDKTYFTPGNYDKSLEITNLIHEQAPISGRFQYLFILSLEALGKKAFAIGDFSKAEEYAMRILQITYRPEGANLLAQVYVKKIERYIADKQTQQAAADLNFISAFQIPDAELNKKLDDYRKLLTNSK